MDDLKTAGLSKDNKRLIFSLAMLLLAALLTYKIPHDSYSVAEYIIKPITSKGGGTFYPSGLIPVTIALIGILEFVNLKKFKNKNKFLIFLLVVMIIMPLIKWTLDFTRTNYYWINQDKLNAVDIEDSNISLGSNDDELTININLELKDYGRRNNNFKIRVYLPKSLSEYTGVKTYESEGSYTTHGYRGKTKITESMVVDLNDDAGQISDMHWSNEDVVYELYNEDEMVRIIHHGV